MAQQVKAVKSSAAALLGHGVSLPEGFKLFQVVMVGTDPYLVMTKDAPAPVKPDA